jgi:ParB-like chromosome segregation protein Spo0J
MAPIIFLEDGFHRVEAAKRAGVGEIEAEVLPGTLADMEADFQEYLKALKKSLSD